MREVLGERDGVRMNVNGRTVCVGGNCTKGRSEVNNDEHIKGRSDVCVLYGRRGMRKSMWGAV